MGQLRGEERSRRPAGQWQAPPANALGYTATHYFSSEASSRVVTDRLVDVVVSNVKIAWAESGAQSRGHIYQVTGRGPRLGDPKTPPFLSVRGHCEACGGLDSKPRETSYSAGNEAEHDCNAGFYESGCRVVDRCNIVIVISYSRRHTANTTSIQVVLRRTAHRSRFRHRPVLARPAGTTSSAEVTNHFFPAKIHVSAL